MKKMRLGQNQLRQIKESLEFKCFFALKTSGYLPDGKLPLVFFFMLGFVPASFYVSTKKVLVIVFLNDEA